MNPSHDVIYHGRDVLLAFGINQVDSNFIALSNGKRVWEFEIGKDEMVF